MRLGNAVFDGWVASFALLGADPALTGNAALQLRLNVSTTSLFERIGATAREDC
ncbi:MAG TPA: hypothetical protein VGZ31_02045 [Chthoniobacterales bacterium]|jgi:hypothetical protein|nr:hypothetical protein [Chthoniobacterales bacterium]